MSTDVLISFDSTGSMASCIGLVRQRVQETVKRILSTIPDCRMAVIVHGDYCDHPSIQMQIMNFTDDEEELVRFVQNAKNTNGGDNDEFYEKVINVASYLDWQADNKIFMLIGDAKPHQPSYSYRDVCSRTFDWKHEADNLNSLGVNIYSVQALDRRESDFFYKEVAERTNGKHVRLNQFSDSVETILAICYHKTGDLEGYKTELETSFKMNRNLANLLRDLDKNVTVSTEYVRKDASGLIPVSPARFQVLSVDHNCGIKEFVQSMGMTFKIGHGFYELSKSELVQERKEVILQNKLTGDFFTGAEARMFIGLPFGTRGKVSPKYGEIYNVYIQSTSPNRKLIAGCKFLYEE